MGFRRERSRVGAVARRRGLGGVDTVPKPEGPQIEMAIDFDFRHYHGEWAHDHLVAAVKDDIVRGRVAP